MKKIISIILAIVLFGTANICSYALDSEIEGLSEKLEALFVQGKFTEEKCDELMRQWEQRQRDTIIDSINLGAPWYAIEKPYRGEINFENKTEDEKIDLIVEYLRPDFKTGVLTSCFNSPEYIDQYAQAGCFEYMFSGKKYWEIFRSNSVVRCVMLNENGNYIENWQEFSPHTIPVVVEDKSVNFLTDKNRIEKMLKDAEERLVTDIQLFNIRYITFLYIKCEANEYLIKIDDEFAPKLPQIELFKLYNITDVTDALKKTEYKSEKPTYETEAIALQNSGLLEGNEKGLDLLKPLTRAEAVTLLVRAVGEEDQTVQYTESAFSDIAADNWAAPYAALAKAKGIAAGVSATEFAPDNRVTSDQFATFVLRAAGETNVDYTQATQLLIDRGIITAEEAETMDLFTRGDMAKIIYEAREKGLL